MKWLVVVVALVYGCRGNAPPAGGGSAAAGAGSALGAGSGSSGERRGVDPSAGSAAAGSAAVNDPWAVDPWAGSGAGSADTAPSLFERHRLADAACPSVTGPYFFAVEKDGKTNHLLGTRHISVPLAKFPGVVRDTIDHAKLAVFEVAPDDKSSAHKPDIALDTAVGVDDWNKYTALVGATTAEMMAHSRPSTALIQMMVEYEDISAMLDMEIEHEVAGQHIPARGLETAAFQDDLLDQLLDLRALRTAIEQTKDRAEIQQNSHDDLAEYCAGTDEVPGTDEKDRKQMLAGGYTDQEIDHVDDLMVFQRNARWIPKLEQLFASGDVLVAVGADHLIGERGVVSLLRKRGFTVTRITK